MMGFFRPLFEGRTYRHLAYLALAFPLGLAYFVFLVTGLAVGAALTVVWVGLLILLVVLLAWRGLGTFERGLHRAFFGIDIPEPATTLRGDGSLWQRIKRLLADAGTWRTLLWLFLRFPLGVATFALLVSFFSVSLTFIASPLLIGLDLTAWAGADVDPQWLTIGNWTPEPVDAWWLVPSGIFLFVVTLHLTNGLAWIHAVIGRALLGPSAREREEVLEARATQLEERTRLAHELHDSIGHAVTLMVVQAGAGRKVIDNDPDFVRESLEVIETTGRQSLGELDRVLTLLRSDGAAGVEPPTPDLGDIDALVSRVRDTDVPVTLTVHGNVHLLPRDLQSTTYRVVQEALTNVMRHAGSPTTVTVDARGSSLDVEIVNEPSPVSRSRREAGAGRGIVGIRERVGAYGGSSEIGPTADGGFRVWVRFPLL